MMMRIAALATAAIHASALVPPPRLQVAKPRAQTARGMAPIGETVKNTAIVTWLFGGLVPALIAVNTFAFTKLSAPARYEGFVETDGQGAKMALASLGAPDAVLEEDVSQILDAFATPDESLFVPLAELLLQRLACTDWCGWPAKKECDPSQQWCAANEA